MSAILIEAAQWTQSDPRILIAARAWSACMVRSGFDQTNLVNTWLTVEAAYQQTLVGQNATSLSRLQANFGALLRRAEDLLQLPAATGILRVSRGRVSRGNLPFVRAR